MTSLGDPSLLERIADRYDLHSETVCTTGRHLRHSADTTTWSCDAADRFRVDVLTTQLIAVEGGQVRERIPGLQVRYLGRSPAPLGPEVLAGNAFKIVVRDLEGRLRFLNPKAEAFYGWDRDSALGEDVRTLQFASDPEGFAQQMFATFSLEFHFSR